MNRIGLKNKHHAGRDEAAFALPTILIASFVMLLVLTSVLTSVSSSVVSALDAAHYNMYTKNAAQSGLACHCLNLAALSAAAVAWVAIHQFTIITFRATS